MDPDVTLERLRSLISEWEDIRGDRYGDSARMNELLNEIRDHFRALDDWLTEGGFRPAAWDRPWFRFDPS